MSCLVSARITLSVSAALAIGAVDGSLHAQDPRAALDSLRAMSLDSVPGAATVYFRPHDRERALQLRSMAEEYLAFWNPRLGSQLQLRIAVLSPDDWQKITRLPYGFPNAIAAPANLVPAPATPPPATGIDTLYIQGQRQRDWMLIAHEGGHLLTWWLLPPEVLAGLAAAAPGDTAMQRHARRLSTVSPWFWEYAANYLTTGFLQERHPDDGAAWVRYLETLATPAARRFSHLDDWFGRLMRERAEDGSPYFLTSEGAPNFAWYQGVTGVLGAHVLAQQGDAIGHIRQVLSSNEAPTTEQLIAGIEAIAPGARALVDSLGAGYERRGGRP
jgi:hypothetical protein